MNSGDGMRSEAVVGVETFVDPFNWVRSKPIVGVGGVDGALGVGSKSVVGVETRMDGGNRMGGKPVMSMESRMDSSDRVGSKTIVGVGGVDGGDGVGSKS